MMRWPPLRVLNEDAGWGVAGRNAATVRASSHVARPAAIETPTSQTTPTTSNEERWLGVLFWPFAAAAIMFAVYTAAGSMSSLMTSKNGATLRSDVRPLFLWGLLLAAASIVTILVFMRTEKRERPLILLAIALGIAGGYAAFTGLKHGAEIYSTASLHDDHTTAPFPFTPAIYAAEGPLALGMLVVLMRRWRLVTAGSFVTTIALVTIAVAFIFFASYIHDHAGTLQAAAGARERTYTQRTPGPSLIGLMAAAAVAALLAQRRK